MVIMSVPHLDTPTPTPTPTPRSHREPSAKSREKLFAVQERTKESDNGLRVQKYTNSNEKRLRSKKDSVHSETRWRPHNIKGICHGSNATCEKVYLLFYNWKKYNNHRQGEGRDVVGPEVAWGNPTLYSEEHVELQQVEFLYIRAAFGRCGTALPHRAQK